MKLKSLEISGFKSFADKTTIEFIPGMTGIVGPNGSGKSNIIEAIRWVMGEQSAKDLRGTKMTDVIFGGTNQRGALNRAEVSMTFDNSDHYVKSDFSEIRISRKLYRSGESTYQINGVDSRLRDVHDLFTDTGLGRESFSIISQGRVESIFNAKPENRRAIIEEVAGVQKYKQNKERAQKDLTQTKENLDRVADIIYEIEKRLEPLAEQSAQATDYLSQKERFEQLDTLRLALMHQEINEQIEQLTQNLKLQDARVNEKKAQLDEQHQLLSIKRDERTRLQTTKDEQQDVILQVTQERERLLGAQQLNTQQVTSLEKDIVYNQSQVKQLEDDLAAVTPKIKQLSSDQLLLNEEYQDIVVRLQKFDTKQQHAQQQTLEQAIEQQRHIYIQLMQEIATLHNTLQNDEKLQNTVSSRLQLLSQRLVNETAILGEFKAELGSDVDNQGVRLDLSPFQQAITQLQEDIQQKTKHYQQDEKTWYQLLNDLNKYRSQRDALNALDEYAGFYQGVRALMKPNVRKQYTGIQGVVAELMTVPTNYTLAIETALGGALQQIVVDTTSTAKQVIQYLTKNRAGRVTILPIDTIKPRRLSGVEQVRNLSGFVGVAADLVDMPQKMDNIKANLLGHTVVAANLEAATQIARMANYRFRVVSLDGQIVNAGGSLTGGAHQKQGATILGRQAELKQLETKVSDLTNSAQQLEKALQHQRTDIEKKRTELQNLESEYQVAQNEANQVDYVATRQQDKIKQQQRNVDALRYEIDDLNKQEDELKTQLLDAQSRLKQAEQQKILEEEKTAQLKNELTQIIQQSQVDLNDKATLQTQQATVKTKLDNVNEQLTALNTQQNDFQQRLENVQNNIVMLEEQLQLTQNHNLSDKQLQIVDSHLNTAQKKLAEAVEQIDGITTLVLTLENQFESQQTALRDEITNQNKVAADLARLETKFESIQSELLTAYHLVDVSDILAEQQNTVLSDVIAQLSLVKKSLDEIGTVNIGAITEYEEVKTRFEFLTKQRDDLQLASNTLLQTIEEMDQEVQERFKITFDEIAEHFSRIFSQMFGGGRAEICLTEPDNLLTTGVDIIAQPPGKKFQQMSLLSGGEKALTAITLLFAILQVRPVPFVVFDEAEAALDEANVDRFAQYLRRFSGNTQFIVITHRKGTMMQANLLYGVTMQEAGISKMIAVDLDKATESVG